jgi:hypothetical protein
MWSLNINYHYWMQFRFISIFPSKYSFKITIVLSHLVFNCSVQKNPIKSLFYSTCSVSENFLITHVVFEVGKFLRGWTPYGWQNWALVKNICEVPLIQMCMINPGYGVSKNEIRMKVMPFYRHKILFYVF